MKQPIEAVSDLAHSCLRGDISISGHRRFADVLITDTQPVPQSGGFYPNDRALVTAHGDEVAWLFECLRDAFCTANGYGTWKEELFGRFGNAANWYLAHNTDASAQDLCLAIMCEAFDCADEVEATGGLQWRPITVENAIADDARDPFDGSRPSSASAARAHLSRRGVGM